MTIHWGTLIVGIVIGAVVAHVVVLGGGARVQQSPS